MLLSHRFSLQLLKLQSAQDIECHHCSFFRIFTIFVVNYISSVFPKLNTQPCTPFIPMFLPYTTSPSPKLFHFQPIQAKAHSPCVSYFILLAGLMHSHFSAFQALLQFWLFPDLLSSVPPQNTSNPFSLTALGGSYFSQFPGPSVVLWGSQLEVLHLQYVGEVLIINLFHYPQPLVLPSTSCLFKNSLVFPNLFCLGKTANK